MKCVLSALSSIIVLTNLFSSKKNSPQLMLLSTEVCCGFSSSTNSRCIWRLNQNGRKTAVIVAMEAISKSKEASPRILLFIKFEMGSVIFGVRTTSVLGKLRGLPLPSMAAVLNFYIKDKINYLVIYANPGFINSLYCSIFTVFLFAFQRYYTLRHVFESHL